MARRSGTVKLSIVSAFDDRGAEQAERALQKFQKRFDLAANSQRMALAKQSVALDRWASDFEKKYTRVGKTMQAVGRSMTSAGDTLTRGVTLPLLATGGAALKAAIDWESAFAGVEKTVDGTTEQMAALKVGIRNMANELPASREAIAGVAAAAGQLGIQTDNVLGFTRVMIDLGESTNLSAEEGATALARLANITGMAQTDFSKLGSSIVALGNNMATTEAEIVQMGMRIAGAGKQIGLTEPEIMGIAAALSSVGIEAEAGGSAISKTMIEIESSVQNGGKALKTWAQTAGMSAKEFSAAWKKDPAKALDSVVTGLGKMEEQGGSTLLQLEKLGITELRQRDALLRLAGASGLLTSAVDLSSKAWDENTALAEEAAKRYATTASQLAIAKNRVTDAAVSLGEGLTPALLAALDAAEPLLEWVKETADAFAALEPKQQQQIVKYAAIAAAIGPVLSVTGRLVTSVGGMVKTIGSAVTWLARKRAAHLADVAATDASALAAGRLGKAMGAIKWAGYIAGAALAKKAWDDLSPAAMEYADAVERGEAQSLRFGEAAAAPISSLGFAWRDAENQARKFNETGETTFKWTDALKNPISSLFYGINLLTGSMDKQADTARGTKGAVDAYTKSLQAQREATYAAVDAQLEAENADIALERSKLRLTAAQKAYDAAVEEFGPNSLEATEATLDLRQAAADLEGAERRAGNAILAVNSAMKNVPRPNGADMQGWVDYYKAIGDQAGYAAAKANLANTNLRNGVARSGTGGRNVPVYGSGAYVTRPHLAVVGDENEYIINPKAPNAMGLLDKLLADMGARFTTHSSSGGITIAPGAVQVSIGGTNASPSAIGAAIEDALRRTVRNARLMGA
jgi:TP901 family phage tail tape measure protein